MDGILCLVMALLAVSGIVSGLDSKDLDLSFLLGNNAESEKAWSKLFELQHCDRPHSLSSTIIMVNESVTAGAKYIGNPDVSGLSECQFECCYKSKEGCNIAVYAEKENNCYLFDCGSPSRCKFDTHDGYSVTLITEIAEVEKTTSKETTTIPSSTTAAPAKKLKLLEGCRPGTDMCEIANSECTESAGLCLCRKGYHAKNSVCRKDCLADLEFECINGNAQYATPDCIAIYDVCDGTPQCPDGSDEKDCSQAALDWLNESVDQPIGDKSSGRNHKQDIISSAPSTDWIGRVKDKWPANQESDRRVEALLPANQGKDRLASPAYQPLRGQESHNRGYNRYSGDSTRVREGGQRLADNYDSADYWYDRKPAAFRGWQQQQQQPSSLSTRQPAISNGERNGLMSAESMVKSSQDSASKVKVTAGIPSSSVAPPTNTSVTPAAMTLSHDIMASAASANQSAAVKNLTEQNEAVGNRELQIDDELRLDRADSDVTTGSQGAVVALAVSLSLTLLLLGYLGCRYRSMKRRVTVRNGKPMSGTEVDYLIDGMYL